MKIIHIKSEASVALPIYTSDLSHLDMLKKAEKPEMTPKQEVKTKSSMFTLSLLEDFLKRCFIQLMCFFQGAAAKKQAKKSKTENVKQTDASGERDEEEEEDEEIPQLVPIATPSKKPKLEVGTFHSCQI